MSASGGKQEPEWDLFVCHAGEDKAEFVDPLVRALIDRGLRVWYDRFQVQIGDDFRRKMEEGLTSSRFGVVVVSPSFAKYWPQQELSVLHVLESVDGAKRILPIRRELTWQELLTRAPFLATRACAQASDGVDAVADQVADAVRGAAPALKPGSSRLFNVPDPTEHFVGRDDDLRELRSLLLAGDAAVSAAIGGLAGVGKSELAIQLARRLAQEGAFPAGIYWLPAEKPDLTATWGVQVADAMAVPDAPAKDRADQVIRDLSRRRERLLVILDNVTDWAREQRPHPLPTGTHVTRLVTTQRSDLGHGLRSYHLEVLHEDASRQLLSDLSGRDLATDRGLQPLLDYLGGHALALELAGAYLREYPEVTPTEYLARLSSDPTVENGVASQARYERTVSEALATTWEALGESARQAWLLAACFAPEPASVALSDACGFDGEARRELRRFHLIDDVGDGWWRMHRLTRAFGQRAGNEPGRSNAKRAFVDGCRARAQAIDLAAGFRIYAPERTHFDAALGEAAVEVSPAEAAMFQDRIATALQSMGELRAARTLFEAALASAIKYLGEDNPSVATSHANLAGVLEALGDLKGARELLDRALASGIKNFGEDHPSVATIRANLAGVLGALGDLKGARELLDRALASAIKNLGVEHPSVATNRSQLAVVLKALGDLKGARELLDLALASDIENLGEDHPSVATRRSNLAGVLQEQGDLRGARELLDLALASNMKNLGEDHPSVATSRSNLAAALQALGDLRGARELLDLALASNMKNLGEDHPSVATSRSNLAMVLYVLGDLKGARKLLELALASNIKNLGGDHPSVATSRSNFAGVLQALGDFKEARKLLDLALASDIGNFGEGHPSVATRRSNLAGVLRDLGDFKGARRLLELALESDQRSFGREHPSTTISAWNLFTLLADLKDVDEATAVRSEHLLWLLSRDPDELGADQRTIRAMVMRTTGLPGAGSD